LYKDCRYEEGYPVLEQVKYLKKGVMIPFVGQKIVWTGNAVGRKTVCDQLVTLKKLILELEGL
jgi:hypothetical protein